MAEIIAFPTRTRRPVTIPLAGTRLEFPITTKAWERALMDRALQIQSAIVEVGGMAAEVERLREDLEFEEAAG